jgi:hypothetical protein
VGTAGDAEKNDDRTPSGGRTVRERGNMKRDIGVAVVGLGWMGQVHSRGYRRLFDHYPIARSSRGW